MQHAPEDYALGGRVRHLGQGSGRRTLAWESGVIGGYKTLLAYAPADGAAVVLLNNTDAEQAAQRMQAETLLEPLQQTR